MKVIKFGGSSLASATQLEKVSEAVRDLLKNRDGLMLGICNGFCI